MKVAKCFITGENSPAGHQGRHPHPERKAHRHQINTVGKVSSTPSASRWLIAQPSLCPSAWKLYLWRKSPCLLLGKASIGSLPLSSVFLKHTVCSLKPLVPARVLEVNSCHPGKCPSFPQLSLTYSSLYTWLSLNTVTAWDWTSQSLRGLWHAYADGKQACGQEKACRQEENQISLQRGRWKGTSLRYRRGAGSPVALLSCWAGHPENRTQAPSDIFRVPNMAHCLPELCLALCTWKMALWDSFRGKHAFIKLLDQIASLLPSFFFMRHDGLLHLWLKKSVIGVVAFSVSLGGDHDVDAQRNWRMMKRRHVLIYREPSFAHCWPRGSCSNGPLLSWLDWHGRSEGRWWTYV